MCLMSTVVGRFCKFTKYLLRTTDTSNSTQYLTACLLTRLATYN